MAQESEEAIEGLSEYEQQYVHDFRAVFPNPIKPQLYKKSRVLWCFRRQTGCCESSCSPLDHQHPGTSLHQKLESLLAHLSNYYWPNCYFIQLWVPTTTRGGRQVLTTVHLPFAVGSLDTHLAQHRIRCEDYWYDVDVNSPTDAQQAHHVDNLPIIKEGPPATAFLNHSPRVIHDLSRVEGKKGLYLLLADALDHQLNSGYVVYPIYDPGTSSCVAVLESYFSALNVTLDAIFAATKAANLIAYDFRKLDPNDTISGFKQAMDEIEATLKTLCLSNMLRLSQAWIRNEHTSHLPVSSITEPNGNDSVLMQSKQVFAVKFHDYYNWGLNNTNKLYDFKRDCDFNPIRMGEGLVGKTFKNHKSYLCRDVSMLDKSLSYTDGIQSSCFAICLRNTNTKDLDYVLEFFWYDSRDVKELLKSILLNLKRNLPSFVDITGKGIDIELCVEEISYSFGANKYIEEYIDMSPQRNRKQKPCHEEVIERQPENLDGLSDLELVSGEEVGSESRDKEVSYSNEANKSVTEDNAFLDQTNPTPKRKHSTSPISLDQKVIEQQFGKTQKEAVANLRIILGEPTFSLSTLKRKCKDVGINEWPGPKKGKGKVNESQGLQNGLNRDNIRASQGPAVVDETVLNIKAKYRDDLIKFSLPFSTATLEAVHKEIFKRFSLESESYKLKYYDERKDLISIILDEDFRNCVESFRLSTDTTIRLEVVVPIA